MLFHEIYSTYFQTVGKILTEAVEHPLTTGEISSIIQNHAFEESALNIPESLGMARWQLLKEDGTTILTIHNYIDVDEMILRKGAIAAHAGEKVLIPINMRDGSILAVGKGNVEWNNSAPHGAGRIMSRTKAKQSIDLEKYKASMQGIYSTSVNADTLDEAPMAYKSLADIIDEIRDSVDIIDIMKPVYNFKASDGEVPWKKKGGTNERKDTGSASQNFLVSFVI